MEKLPQPGWLPARHVIVGVWPETLDSTLQDWKGLLCRVNLAICCSSTLVLLDGLTLSRTPRCPAFVRRVFGDDSQWWRFFTSMFPLGSVWELMLCLHAIRVFRVIERYASYTAQLVLFVPTSVGVQPAATLLQFYYNTNIRVAPYRVRPCLRTATLRP